MAGIGGSKGEGGGDGLIRGLNSFNFMQFLGEIGKDFPEVGHKLPSWCYFTNYFAENCMKTRMHSSRMCTVHCSGHLLGGRSVWPGGVCPGGVSA